MFGDSYGTTLCTIRWSPRIWEAKFLLTLICACGSPPALPPFNDGNPDGRRCTQIARSASVDFKAS